MVSCMKTMCSGRSSRTEQPFVIFVLVLSYAPPKLPSPEVGPTYLISPKDLFSFWTLANSSCFPAAPWAIPVWKAASFWLSAPSCRFLWALALGEAVKSQSPFILSMSLVASQTYTTFPWKDSCGSFVPTFRWSMPVLHCSHNWKTASRLMLNFQGDADFFKSHSQPL